MRLVINTCFGGFSLSRRAIARIDSLKGMPFRDLSGEYYGAYDYNEQDQRADPFLVQAVYELGKAANGTHACLKIVEIPDGVDFYIDEYDGVESVHEKHRSWR